jgi:diguanylate cyclase (GGDEF)-like protein
MFAATVAPSFGFLIMHRERAEQALRTLAMHDALTGLFNRRAFTELCEREVARSRRAGASFAVLMLDLDHFKRVNDSQGHQAGDQVLADFARRAQRCMRAGDILGRYGGEEFCALLAGAARKDAMAAAERIRAQAEQPPLGALPWPVTVTIGVAVCESGGQAALDAVIARADQALYGAKRSGRNRVMAAE